MTGQKQKISVKWENEMRWRVNPNTLRNAKRVKSKPNCHLSILKSFAGQKLFWFSVRAKEFARQLGEETTSHLTKISRGSQDMSRGGRSLRGLWFNLFDLFYDFSGRWHNATIFNLFQQWLFLFTICLIKRVVQKVRTFKLGLLFSEWQGGKKRVSLAKFVSLNDVLLCICMSSTNIRK